MIIVLLHVVSIIANAFATTEADAAPVVAVTVIDAAVFAAAVDAAAVIAAAVIAAAVFTAAVVAAASTFVVNRIDHHGGKNYAA